MTLTITEAAARQLGDLLAQQEGEKQAIRIVAAVGGCSCSGGVRFGMGFDAPGADDLVIDAAGIRFLLDADTQPHIEGASIDYVDDVMQQGFSIEAPNAKAAAGGGACACGAGGH